MGAILFGPFGVGVSSTHYDKMFKKYDACQMSTKTCLDVITRPRSLIVVGLAINNNGLTPVVYQ
jgi:hypothetical protein